MARNLDQVKECLRKSYCFLFVLLTFCQNTKDLLILSEEMKYTNVYGMLRKRHWKRYLTVKCQSPRLLYQIEFKVINCTYILRHQFLSVNFTGMGGGQDDAQQNRSGTSGTSFSSNFSFSLGGDNTAAYSAHPGEGEGVVSRGGYNPSGGASSSLTGPVSGGPGAYNGGTSSMSGLGNPNFKDPRDEVSFMQRVAMLADTASEKLSSLTSSSGSANPTFAGPGGSTGHSDYNMRSNRGADGSIAPPYGSTGAPAVGAWGNPLPASSTMSPAAAAFANRGANTGSFSASNTGPVPAFSPPEEPRIGGGGIVPDIPSQGVGMGRAGAAASDGQYEQQMVTSLCEPGGMKAVPPEDKLQAFLLAAPTLSPEVVGESLMDCLNSDSYQSRVKALLVIAALAKGRGCGGHSAWWKDSGMDDLQAVAQGDSKASVRTQAVKTLRALGASVSSEASASVGAVRASRRAAAPAQEQSQAQTAPANVSLIDFEEETLAPVTPVKMTAESILDMMDSPQPPVVAPAGAGGLFDGMSVGAPAQEEGTRARRPSVPAPVAAQDPSLQASVFNFLDSMDVYSSDSIQPPPAPVAEASGFSFISSGASGVVDQIKPTPAVSNGPLDLSQFESLSVNGSQQQQQPPKSGYDLSGLNMSVPYHQPMAPRGYPPQHMYPPQQGYPPQQQGRAYVPMAQGGMGSSSPQVGVRKVIPDSTSGG